MSETKRLTAECRCGRGMKSGQTECYYCRRTRKALEKEAKKEGTASNVGVAIAIKHGNKPGVLAKIFGW